MALEALAIEWKLYRSKIGRWLGTREDFFQGVKAGKQWTKPFVAELASRLGLSMEVFLTVDQKNVKLLQEVIPEGIFDEISYG